MCVLKLLLLRPPTSTPDGDKTHLDAIDPIIEVDPDPWRSKTIGFEVDGGYEHRSDSITMKRNSDKGRTYKEVWL